MRGDSEGDASFLPSLGTRGLLLCCREIDSSASGLVVPARFAACNATFPRAGGGTFALEVPSLLPKMFSGPMTDFSYCSRFWGRSTWRTTLGDFIAWRKTSWALEGANDQRMTLCSGAGLAEVRRCGTDKAALSVRIGGCRIMAAAWLTAYHLPTKVPPLRELHMRDDCV